MFDYDNRTKELLKYRLEPTPYTRVPRQIPKKTNDLYVIADFHSHFGMEYSGLRNINLIEGITESLAEEWNVIRCDIGTVPQEEWAKHNGCTGAHHLVGQTEGANIFVIQSKYAIINDLGFSKTIYFHIDGPERIGIRRLKFAMKMYNAAGDYDYRICEHFRGFFPFVFLDKFNPDREKDIMISCIDRKCSFQEYKEILERSQFTIIDCRDADARRSLVTITSKRVFQALACKTIPIIIGNPNSVYKKLCIDDKVAMFMTHFIDKSYIAYKYDPEMAERGYKLMQRLYSGKKAMKTIKAICRRIYKHG